MSRPNALADIADLEISISEHSMFKYTEDSAASSVRSGGGNTAEGKIPATVPREVGAVEDDEEAPPSRTLSWGSTRNIITGSVQPMANRDSLSSVQTSSSSQDGRQQQLLQQQRRSHPLISALQALPESHAHVQPVAATAVVASRVDRIDQMGQLNDDDEDAEIHYDSEGSSSLYKDWVGPTTPSVRAVPLSNNNKHAKGNAKKKHPTKGVLKNGKAAGGRRTARPLSAISKMYDLDGDGQLDEIEQAMRDRDLDGDGHLDNREVARIVRDQLKSQHDMGLYRKVAAGLVCLVAILTLTNFGTSWATAILAKEVNADADTGTIQSKNSGEVMGFQQVGHVVEMEELTDEEFDERRRLVDSEMEEDPDHEDHLHRRLGKRKDNKCTCSKIAYDHNKIRERDLEELTRRCDGVNTVSMKRKWKDIMEGSYDEDYDTICGPGTVVVRKGKKKSNKHKTKVKVVDQRVTFRSKGKNMKARSVNFDCDGRGNCYTSGETLLQGLGHPCNPKRDLVGASECEEDLFCHDPDGWGSGTCVRLQRYSREDQVCDVDFGVDACVSGYACKSMWDGRGKKKYELQVHAGTCQRLAQRSAGAEVCDASLGDNACAQGYMCLGANGFSELYGKGMGVCTLLIRRQRSGGICDLSYGRDACVDGYYCRDSLLKDNGWNRQRRDQQSWYNYNNGRLDGNGQINGLGAGVKWAANGAGPGNSGGGKVVVRSRSYGTGFCVSALGAGAKCYTHEECGYAYECIGLGGSWGGPSGFCG